jgi:hypothetical protein
MVTNELVAGVDGEELHALLREQRAGELHSGHESEPNVEPQRQTGVEILSPELMEDGMQGKETPATIHGVPRAAIPPRASSIISVQSLRVKYSRSSKRQGIGRERTGVLSSVAARKNFLFFLLQMA